MTIGDRIRTCRLNKKLSQTDLAEASGVNLKSISRYETNASIPPADLLKNIANVLEVSVDFLLGDESIEVKDKALFKKFEIIQQMSGNSKLVVEHFLDMAIRDFKAKQAYAS